MFKFYNTPTQNPAIHFFNSFHNESNFNIFIFLLYYKKKIRCETIEKKTSRTTRGYIIISNMQTTIKSKLQSQQSGTIVICNRTGYTHNLSLYHNTNNSGNSIILRGKIRNHIIFFSNFSFN